MIGHLTINSYSGAMATGAWHAPRMGFRWRRWLSICILVVVVKATTASLTEWAIVCQHPRQISHIFHIRCGKVGWGSVLSEPLWYKSSPKVCYSTCAKGLYCDLGYILISKLIPHLSRLRFIPEWRVPGQSLPPCRYCERQQGCFERLGHGGCDSATPGKPCRKLPALPCQ